MSPIHSLVLPYDQFHGGIKLPGRSTGLVLYGSAGAALVSRQLVVPANPKSTAQVEARGFLSAAAAAWKLLTAEEAGDWRDLAAQLDKSNILGLTYTLTGIGVYCQVNVLRQYAGEAILDTVPDIADIPIPITAITSCTFAGTTLTTVINCTGLADGAEVFLRVTPSITRASRQLRRNELRIPTIASASAFGTVATNACTIALDPDLITVAAAEYCGLEVTAMSAEYLPRAPWFVPHQLIA